VNFDRWRATDGTITNDAQFINGVFTTPQPGVYHCCSSFRCKQTGYCDFAIVRRGAGSTTDNYYAAFGTRNTRITSNGWASHGTCATFFTGTGVTIQVNLESTAGTDCIEETSWKYGRFTCFRASSR